jgi:hypothetical protein
MFNLAEFALIPSTCGSACHSFLGSAAIQAQHFYGVDCNRLIQIEVISLFDGNCFDGFWGHRQSLIAPAFN